MRGGEIIIKREGNTQVPGQDLLAMRCLIHLQIMTIQIKIIVFVIEKKKILFPDDLWAILRLVDNVYTYNAPTHTKRL